MRKRVLWISLVSVMVVAPGSDSIAVAQSIQVHGRILGPGGAALQGDVTVIEREQGVNMRTYPTDNQGEFSLSLDAVRGPTILLVAKADGHVSAERVLTRRAAQARLEFVLSEAGSVSGRVVDEIGLPVPEALVRVWYPGERRSYMFGDELGEEHADAFGYFTLPLVAEGKPFHIQAEADDRLPSLSGVLKLNAKRMQGAIVVLPGRGQVVRGRVLDQSGAPVPNANVHLVSLPAEGEFTPEERETPGFAASTNKARKTGPDGAFEFRGVPAGEVAAVATFEGRPPAKAEGLVGNRQALDLVLRLP